MHSGVGEQWCSEVEGVMNTSPVVTAEYLGILVLPAILFRLSLADKRKRLPFCGIPQRIPFSVGYVKSSDSFTSSLTNSEYITRSPVSTLSDYLSASREKVRKQRFVPLESLHECRCATESSTLHLNAYGACLPLGPRTFSLSEGPLPINFRCCYLP